MNENNKKKLDKIKQKTKEYAPAVLSLSAAVGTVALFAFSAMKAAEKATLSGDESDWTLPVITGEEKEEILRREDSVLQRLEDDVYFLSFPRTETPDED